MSYIALSLGLFIFIFAFFSFNAPPKTEVSPKNAVASNFCQIADPTSAPTFQAPPDNADKIGGQDDEALGTPLFGGGCGNGRDPRHQFGTELVTYRLLRKNVPLSKTEVKNGRNNFDDESCHFDSADKLDIEIPEIDQTKYRVFYPQISGEISLDREIPSRTRGRDSKLMYFIDYGLVFLLHLDEEGNFIEYQGGTTNGKSETFYLADIYQDIDSGRPTLPEEAFSCDAERGVSSSTQVSVIEPEQEIPVPADQLQLQYFVFDTKTSQVVNGWGIHCKPAIYLYPKEKQLINVKVQTKGHLTYVDPPYNAQKGWAVEALPNGTIYDLASLNYGKTYPYLYYESKLPRSMVKKPETGWVIKTEELESFFNSLLPRLGLNQKESRDFTEYWGKTLIDSPYFFVGLLDQPLVNNIEPLYITPKPDLVNRVRFYFEPMQEYFQIPQPNLSEYSSLSQALNLKFEIFYVSEWGGVVDTGKDELFVCNQ